MRGWGGGGKENSRYVAKELKKKNGAKSEINRGKQTFEFIDHQRTMLFLLVIHHISGALSYYRKMT